MAGTHGDPGEGRDDPQGGRRSRSPDQAPRPNRAKHRSTGGARGRGHGADIQSAGDRAGERRATAAGGVWRRCGGVIWGLGEGGGIDGKKDPALFTLIIHTITLSFIYLRTPPNSQLPTHTA